jgi:hypothetical protein
VAQTPIPPFQPSLLERLYAAWAERVDRTIGWMHVPRYTGTAILGGLRIRLRLSNLTDTTTLPTNGQEAAPTAPRQLTARTADGSWNDLKVPTMGRSNTRFGRNVPNDRTYPDPVEALVEPNPRRVSRELLTRHEFIPAGSLNLHAASWIQFMVHDWLSHGDNPKENPWSIPLEPDDDWPGERPMQILRTRPDPTRPDRGTEGPPTFLNTAVPWWDASQLYGNDQQKQDLVRSGEGGRLQIQSNRLLPLDDKGIPVTGVSGNWWLGLELMHTLFTLEHNAIADALHAEYPSWTDKELFDRARLILAALTAKIHTVEWTLAILANPTAHVVLRANWWGLQGEALHRLFGRLSKRDWLSGIPGSDTDHFGVPYSITEEFVAVYRMHPLLRDDHPFASSRDGKLIENRDLSDIIFAGSRPALERIGLENALYSFGLMNPGAVTLFNYPRVMQRLPEPNGTFNDLGAIDIMRSRERGVPRYNEFRRLMHKAPLTRFEQISDREETVEQIRDLYDGDLERVDLQIGLYGETPPPGYGFSDTAFRIFVLMASRRLNSDRFFTVDYTPEVYTPLGMRWIENNGFASVLLRHCPGLRPALRAGRNPFAPWDAVA